jgi:SAM-dependent methyltransferase
LWSLSVTYRRVSTTTTALSSVTAGHSRRVQLTDWDHNRWYHRLLLRQVPPGAQRVLDVGCGAGRLVRDLADRVPRVEGADRSPDMIAAARLAAPTATLHLADVLSVDLPDGAYDAVLSSAVLHHLPLAEALPRMARWLKPGGVLAAVAVPRIDLPRDAAVELAAAATHHGLGLAFAGLRPLTGADLLRHEATHDVMPIADPGLTTRDVRAAARDLLPGAQVRRLLLWRYLLTWRKPF